MKRVVDLYLSNSSVLVEELRLAVSQADAEAVRQSAHALKSSSQNVGAQGVASLGKKIEEMGRSGELEGSEESMAELDEVDKYKSTTRFINRGCSSQEISSRSIRHRLIAFETSKALAATTALQPSSSSMPIATA